MATSINQSMAIEHRTKLPVQCPVCHWKHFLEVNFDGNLIDTPQGREIQRQLHEWLVSRCPDHLGPIMETMKN